MEFFTMKHNTGVRPDRRAISVQTENSATVIEQDEQTDVYIPDRVAEGAD
jgi:hypothetical protein